MSDIIHTLLTDTRDFFIFRGLYFDDRVKRRFLESLHVMVINIGVAENIVGKPDHATATYRR